MNETTARLMLLDGHSLVHRAFHAVDTLTTSQGEIVGAVFGFTATLLKAIEQVKPTHIIMALDRPAPTFRHESYAEYKATRVRAPQELRDQFGRVREVAAAFHIPIYELDGYEADDVLGTLSAQAEERGVPVTLVTGDLDALQLVSDSVHVVTPSRGVSETRLYDPEAVRERYGLEPGQLPDWKALVGDTSDNIPGVPGIGGKTASKLLGEFSTLEGIFEHLEEVPSRTRTALEEHREQAFKSRELARIVRVAPVDLDLERAAFGEVNRAAVIDLFRELEFRTLVERIQQLMPASRPQANAGIQQLSMFEAQADAAGPQLAEEEGGVIRTVAPLLHEGEGRSGETATRIVRDLEALGELVSSLIAAGRFAVDTETTGTDPLRARLVGLSFSTEPGRAWYVPVGHAEGEQLPITTVLKEIRPLLEDEALTKVGHNLKYEHVILAQHAIGLRGPSFDTMIAAYLVKTNARGLSLSALALDRLDIEMTSIETLIGKGRSQITMDLVDIDRVAAYAGADADITLRLRDLLERDLAERGLTELFADVEMPLVPVLADMERAGVALDTSVLTEMSRDMTEVIGNLEARIYEIAGRPFNVNSTQQLGQILFGELKLPAGRRTKTGYSTDSEVLERLRGRHEIVDLILEFRQLIKLKNTYIDALPSLISPQDGRVHTDFNQTVAATGRLSSSNPNLQNIPVRGELGRKIRRAFVPTRPGNRLLAADYSQIELRILAAMSKDPRLLHAFTSGEDVHAATASAVFGVPLDAVTPDQRRIAKVVNFGIIYGIGEQRLAYETGITREEAGEFIASYNRTYSGVRAFMDQTRRQAALYGSVSTLLGRRREVPEIHSDNPGIRTAAERAAINHPIQGTAADIIKIAMIRIHRDLTERHPRSKMVLQVHDELVFDVPNDELGSVATIVQEAMERALDLGVPIEVELKEGPNWYEMSPLERAVA